jgi:hypothetical protein
LLRFGWIDAEDWDPQEAPTGQMAGLKQTVYDYKLIPIAGAYRQHAPVILLEGVGPKMAQKFAEIGVHTIADLMAFRDELPKGLARIMESNRRLLDGCYEQS